MALKFLAQVSLEAERAQKETKEMLPGRIAELESTNMQLMAALAESYEASVKLAQENEELQQTIADSETRTMLAIAEIYEMHNIKEG